VVNSQVVLGGILCVLVLALPSGIIPALQDLAQWTIGRIRIAFRTRSEVALQDGAL
jgi:hypothetical protein